MATGLTWAVGGAALFGGLWVYGRINRQAQERARRQRLRAAWGRRVDRGGAEPNYDLRERVDADRANNRVDDQTWSDLLLPTVIERTDRTITAVGSQTLWRWVRRPLQTAEDVEQRSALIDALGRDQERREQIQGALLDFGVGRGRHLVRLFWGTIEDPEVPLWAMRLLPYVLLGSLVGGFLLGSLPLLGLGLSVFIANIVIHNRASHTIAPMLLGMQDVGRLVSVAGRLVKSKAMFDDPSMRPVYEELRAAHEGTERLVWRTAALELRDPLEISEYIKLVFLMEVIRFYRAASLLRATQPKLQRLFDAIGDLDAAMSVANVRAGQDHGESESVCVPRLRTPDSTGNPPRIEATDLRHPLLEHAVGNDLQLPRGSLLVSGSNMSGKTTYLRAVAANAVLAQSIATVYGESYEGAPVRVASCITITDDLLAGRSYYRAELDAILQVVEQAEDGGMLIVLDEIFRGTNPLERTAAASAVLDHLARANMVLAATHDLEIGDRVSDRFSEAHFCESVDGADERSADADEFEAAELDFDYRLRPGRIQRPNAIALLGRVGYPQSLVDRAIELVHEHQRGGGHDGIPDARDQRSS